MTSNQPSLKRILGVGAGLAVSIGIAVGAGIFRTPQGVAQQLPNAKMIMLVWLAGGALALVDAFVLAELSTFVPKAGGWYAYVRKAYGDFPAFLYGWATTVVTYPASVAGVALVLGDYLGAIVRTASGGRIPYGPWQSKAVAVAGIVAFTGLNLIGVRQTTLAQQAFTAAKILAVLLVIGVAFGMTSPTGEGAVATAAGMAATGAITFAAFGVALQSVMWTFDGYGDAITLAEELKDPARDLPRALLGSIALLTALYLTLNAAFLTVLSPIEMTQAGNVAEVVVTRRLGAAGGTLVSALICVIVIGGLNAQLISGPRITFAMARDGLSFDFLSKVNRGGTPSGALILHAACAIAFVLYGKFFDLIALTIFIIWLVNVLNVVAVFLFRARYSAESRAFKMPGYPVIPILALGGYGFALFTMIRETRAPVIAGIIVIFCGVPAFLVWRLTREKMRNAE
jgi:APA family basic amino acid/polyamine antiporter/L-type amino acid transporter 9